MATRYNSYDSCSSVHSDLSDLKSNKPFPSKAIVRSKLAKGDNPGNLSCMMKKLMEMKKPNSKSKSKRVELDSPLVSSGLVGKSVLGTLQRKLFGKEKVKALTEVKGNTRTLSMVLRSERELLSMNKDHENEIDDLKLQLREKNREVEKLKDLCLKQREEIKSLKSAVLFPDVMNSEFQELNQARQIIPSLQQQVLSLTGQLQFIAQDLAQVKANKYMSGSCYSEPQTSSYDSLELSSGSPDRLALEDLNPCLTPYTKTTRRKEFERDSAEESLSGVTTAGDKVKSSSKGLKLSRSSEGDSSKSKTSRLMGKAGRSSEESSKGWYRSGRMF